MYTLYNVYILQLVALGEIYLMVGDKCGKIHFLKWMTPVQVMED